MTGQGIRERFNCIIIVLVLAIILVALESIDPTPSPSGALTADTPKDADIAMRTLCKNTCSDMCDADEGCFKECREHYCAELVKAKAITAITGTI